MVTYGATSYYISVSSTKAGTSPTSYPTGDIIYLYAESYELTRENKDKQKQMAANNSYNNRLGKMAREVNLTRCILLDDDGTATTNTASFNLKSDLLDGWTAIDKAAVYVILVPKVDNPNFAQPNTNRTVNLHLSKGHDYFKGVLTRMRVKPEGNVYFVDLNFKETSLY